MPDRPRLEIVKYAVQAGDTLFGIADKFSLKPATILWGNWDALAGDPHTLSPGQELNILPVDGALHTWSEGENLERVATFYSVDASEILEWPGNPFDPAEDPSTAKLAAGTVLVIPDGKLETPTWKTPRIPRSNPASAKILGAGACGQVVDGPIGTGSFVWPTASKWISGYTYDPGTHPAIDLGGSIGTPIFVSDTGVVVYSGWNDWGYGYVVVIDHGNGWQTLYAHLSSINVGCGQAVFQGGVLGGMGCTGNCSGPHVHFEMMSDAYGKVNPVELPAVAHPRNYERSEARRRRRASSFPGRPPPHLAKLNGGSCCRTKGRGTACRAPAQERMWLAPIRSPLGLCRFGENAQELVGGLPRPLAPVGLVHDKRELGVEVAVEHNAEGVHGRDARIQHRTTGVLDQDRIEDRGALLPAYAKPRAVVGLKNDDGGKILVAQDGLDHRLGAGGDIGGLIAV